MRQEKLPHRHCRKRKILERYQTSAQKRYVIREEKAKEEGEEENKKKKKATWL
jgi:hypothetical protein